MEIMNNKYLLHSTLDINFNSLLNELWEKQKWIPHAYSKLSLEYYKQLLIDDRLSTTDVSFLITKNNLPSFAFIGAHIQEASKLNLMAYKAPCMMIWDENLSDNHVFELAWDMINDLLKSVNGHFEMRDFLQQDLLNKISTNILHLGATTKTQLFQYLDLSATEDQLWKNLRRSYKSLINSGLREMEIKFFDSENITWEQVEEFRLLHATVSGKQTRSIESWQKQFEWVRKGESFIVQGKMGNEIVSIGMFTYTKSMCTYFSSASKRDKFDKPVFHSLLWSAILRAKKIGCQWFDMNEKYFKNSPNVALKDSKLISISDFKIGFSGKLKPVLDFSLDFNCI